VAGWVIKVDHRVGMRIALVTESFLPEVNGVAHSVLRVAEHLVARGHDPMVIAPLPSSSNRGPTPLLPYPVVRLPSLPMPGYPQVRLGLPSRQLTAALRAHGTEMVHLASPFVLGAWGSSAGRTLGTATRRTRHDGVPRKP
jgi:phosphatidylinositol alpha 1,6-mannosyltransferase